VAQPTLVALTGAFSFNQFYPLAAPSSHFMVFEVFLLHIDGAPAPGISTASLQLVEQDWVPEPASLLALGRRTGGACAATPQEVSIVPLSGYEMARQTPRHLFYCRRIASKSWRVGFGRGCV
jgi:hypothetical protein